VKSIRDYALEACWVLCLVMLAAAPHRASARALDWDDLAAFCPDCCNGDGDADCDEWCFCLLDIGSER